MQVISEEIRTRMPSMPIENSEKLAFGPCSFALLLRRFLNIEDNGDTILIVVPNHALIGVGSVRFDHAILFYRALCSLKVRQLDIRHLKGQLQLRCLLSLVKLVLVG